MASAEELSLDELYELIKSAESERSSTMQDAAAAIRDLINERITPEDEQAWTTWSSQHPEDAKQLTALKEEVFALLQEARVLAAKAARLRSLDYYRLRSCPSSLTKGVSRVFSEEPVVLGNVLVERSGLTH